MPAACLAVCGRVQHSNSGVNLRIWLVSPFCDAAFPATPRLTDASVMQPPRSPPAPGRDHGPLPLEARSRTELDVKANRRGAHDPLPLSALSSLFDFLSDSRTAHFNSKSIAGLVQQGPTSPGYQDKSHLLAFPGVINACMRDTQPALSTTRCSQIQKSL